jgi:hypothetical protein
MSEQHFNEWTVGEKMQWILREGEFLMDIRYYSFKVNLYRVSGLLVEVFYYHKQDQIASIHLLDRDSSRMQFYADQVKLEPLTK